MGNRCCREEGLPDATIAATNEIDEKRDLDGVIRAVEKGRETDPKSGEEQHVGRLRRRYTTRLDNDSDSDEPTGASVGLPSSHQGALSGQNHLEWLNYIVNELWPYAEAAVEKLLQTEILPQVEEDLPAIFRPLKASDFDLGDKTPKLGPLFVCSSSEIDEQGVELNLGVEVDCETNILLKAGQFSVGINALTLRGTICVVLRPLMQKLPIVGGLQIYFLKPPTIDFHFAGVGEVVDFPLLDSIIRRVVNKILIDLLVLPNLLYIPLTPDPKIDLDLTSMQSPNPKGVLCLRVNGCKNLHASDWSFFGKPNSDPYVVLSFGGVTQQTEVVKKNVNPTWRNEYFEFLVFNSQQELQIQVFDKDLIQLGKPDLLAELEVSLKDLLVQSSVRKLDTSSIEKTSLKPLESSIDISATLKLFDSATQFAEPSPPETIAMMVVKLHGARGVPAEYTAGTRVDLSFGAKTVTSPKAKYEPAGVATGHSEEVQRLVAHLHDKQKMDPETIAQVSGLSVEAVLTLTEVANCNTCLWFKSFQFPVKDIATIKMLKLDMALGDGTLTHTNSKGMAEIDLSELPNLPGRHLEKHVHIALGPQVTAIVEVEVDLYALVISDVPSESRRTVTSEGNAAAAH